MAALALGFLLVLAGPAAAGGASGHVTLLHFNDFHSQMEPYPAFHDQEIGGAAHLAGAIDIIRADAPDALLLFAGDLFQGTPYYQVFGGRIEVRMLNLMGCAAMTPGNHEFDNGIAPLREALEPARFPVVSANVVVDGHPDMPPLEDPTAFPPGVDGFPRLATPVETATDLPPGARRLAPPYVVLRAGDATVGVVGLTTEELASIVYAPANPGLRALPAAEAVRPWVDTLRGRVDLLVVLSHCGVDADSALALTVPGIDVIVAGHDHRALREPLVVVNDNRNGLGGTLIVSAGSRGSLLGRLDLDLVNGRIVRYAGRVLPIGPAIPADPAVETMIADARAELGTQMETVVAEAPEGLSVEGKYDGDVPLGFEVAEAMREAGTADFAIQNSGGIRASILPGPVKTGDVFTVLPFENRVVVCAMTAAEVQALADFIAAMPPGKVKAQVAGIAFDARGGRAGDVRVAGAPLDPARTYRAAVNDFMFYGGDDYTMFGELKRVEFLDVKLRDAFLERAKRLGVLHPNTEIRIRR